MSSCPTQILSPRRKRTCLHNPNSVCTGIHMQDAGCVRGWRVDLAIPNEHLYEPETQVGFRVSRRSFSVLRLFVLEFTLELCRVVNESVNSEHGWAISHPIYRLFSLIGNDRNSECWQRLLQTLDTVMDTRNK